MPDMIEVAPLAIRLPHHLLLQCIDILCEGVAQAAYLYRFLIPGICLLRVALPIGGKLLHDEPVPLFHGLGRFAETLIHHTEAVEHLHRDVEGQHRDEHQVHQVDHLLTGGVGTVYCHAGGWFRVVTGCRGLPG